MNFKERILKSFANTEVEYGLFKIIGDKSTLISKGSKDRLNDQLETLNKSNPRYAVRRLSNLWSFSLFNINSIELTCNQVLDGLNYIINNSTNKKLSLGSKKILSEFEKLLKTEKIINFAEEFDSSNVETKWTPPEGMFSDWSAKDIAKEVHKSHDTLQSGMACLNFYLNRGGENISDDRRKVIEEAKELLRELYQ